MNIQEAVKESIKTKKLIRRENSVTSCVFMPTNTYDLIVFGQMIKKDCQLGAGNRQQMT